MKIAYYIGAHRRPQTLRLLHEYQSNTLAYAAMRRTRHLDTVAWAPLPPPPEERLYSLRSSLDQIKH